jgi:hypothetical protein
LKEKVVLITLIAAVCSGAHADSGLFGSQNTPDRVERVEEEPVEAALPKSEAGVELGQIVRFKNVGEVFYAGGHEGLDVYFAGLDEPGGFHWKGALSACQRKGPGWLLPTKGELNLLFENKDFMGLSAKGIDPSSGTWYWSASNDEKTSAWRQRFSDGLQQPLKKIFSARVRCVRLY